MGRGGKVRSARNILSAMWARKHWNMGRFLPHRGVQTRYECGSDVGRSQNGRRPVEQSPPVLAPRPEKRRGKLGDERLFDIFGGIS